MAGQIKKMITTIVDGRAKGNQVIVNTTRTKLLLKGIDPEKFNDQSPDDQQVIDKLKTLANELGVAL